MSIAFIIGITLGAYGFSQLVLALIVELMNIFNQTYIRRDKLKWSEK